MADNKTKEQYINNLSEIRQSLGMTQDNMAEILNISLRMYGNYERGIKPLPIEKAKVIAQKYNYSIDYIYRMANTEKRIDQFLTDIRNIISYKDNKIFIKINNSYWKYLYEKNLIEKSNNTIQDKKIRIAKIDSQFIAEKNDVVWQAEFQISKDNFQSHIECGDVTFLYAAENSCENRPKISDVKVQEAQNFLIKLLKNNEDDE